MEVDISNTVISLEVKLLIDNSVYQVSQLLAVLLVEHIKINKSKCRIDISSSVVFC